MQRIIKTHYKKFFIALIALMAFFNIAAMDQQSTDKKDINKAIKKIIKQEGLVSASKEIKEIIAQGIRDFDIRQPVMVLKNNKPSGHKGSSACASGYVNNGVARFYSITYLPWWHRGIHVNDEVRPKFAFRTDLIDQEYQTHPSYLANETKNIFLEKFIMYHELAHIKNGDVDAPHYMQNPKYDSHINTLLLSSVAASSAMSILAWCCRPVSNKIALCTGAAYLFAGFMAYKDFYYNRLLVDSREQESAADRTACRMLLSKNEIKPVIHWMVQQLTDATHKEWTGKTENPAENRGSTHPTRTERFEICMEEITKSNAKWNEALYKEVREELSDDIFRNQKLHCLDAIHLKLLAMQNKKSLQNKKFSHKQMLEREKAYLLF